MGCGQSKIHLYPRKSKSKANGKKTGHGDSDAETDEDEGGQIEDSGGAVQRERDKSDEADEQSNKDGQDGDEEVSVSLLRAKNLSLLQSQEISSSQQNFFRMLDKKIEEGPDYDSASETEIALEEARLNALVQHWESASLTASICSSASRSLQTTPIRQAPPAKQLSSTSTTRAATLLPPTTMLPPVLSAEYQLQLKQMPITLQQQQQLHLISQMNHKMLQQMQQQPQQKLQQLPQMPISMVDMSAASALLNVANASTSAAAAAAANASNSSTTANSSNALALLQQTEGTQPPSTASQQQQLQQQQQQYMLSMPVSQISPKRIIDARLLISANPLAQQMHAAPQLQGQYIPAATAAFVNGGGGVVGVRSTQLPIQLAYYGPTSQYDQQHPTLQGQNQMTQPTFYGDVMHTVQAPTEYRFPPAIAVQRLAPQLQRQLRETQELIKDSCPQLYAAGYGSPGPPMRQQPPISRQNPTATATATAATSASSPTVGSQQAATRRPTLETRFSQELS